MSRDLGGALHTHVSGKRHRDLSPTVDPAVLFEPATAPLSQGPGAPKDTVLDNQLKVFV